MGSPAPGSVRAVLAASHPEGERRTSAARDSRCDKAPPAEPLREQNECSNEIVAVAIPWLKLVGEILGEMERALSGERP
jgi:hypothetical protein